MFIKKEKVGGDVGEGVGIGGREEDEWQLPLDYSRRLVVQVLVFIVAKKGLAWQAAAF